VPLVLKKNKIAIRLKPLDILTEIALADQDYQSSPKFLTARCVMLANITGRGCLSHSPAARWER
jgi:hypothetical protein